MSDPNDRLFELLPVVYRQRDAAEGYPLRDLLRIIGEQVNRLEDDIVQMYENWFIETCEEWVVPYIGDLVGYAPVPSAGQPEDPATAEAQLFNSALIPRREVADLIRNRRRRGTLALLEELVADTSGDAARAVEGFELLAWTQGLNHLRPHRARTADLRRIDALDRIGGAFDDLTRTPDMRRPVSGHTRGRVNIPSAAAFIWRMRAYPVTAAPAAFLQKGSGPLFYTFGVLGNDAPLFTAPVRETDPTTIAGEMNVPAPIRRRAFEKRRGDYYGLHPDGSAKSFVIWKDDRTKPVPVEQIIAADLSDWFYRAPAGKVAVDPVLGRFVFPVNEAPKTGVWVSYRYAFSADIGGGEYARPIRQPADVSIYPVGEKEKLKTIVDAVEKWKAGDSKGVVHPGVIEITDNGVYQEAVAVTLEEKQYLQIRAANRCRPLINLLDNRRSLGEWLNVTMASGSRFVLDGVILGGRPLRIDGAEGAENLRVEVRHCTLVPGWSVTPDLVPTDPAEPSIELHNVRGRLTVDHTITGTIAVIDEILQGDPLQLDLRDSIIDATSLDREAISGPGPAFAYATMSMARCTVFGQVLVHAVDVVDGSIFLSPLRVARRQKGCVRFCYVEPENHETPPVSSRTPRRYHCEPDLILAKVREDNEDEALLDAELAEGLLQVRPRFDSMRFGRPDYARLALDCSERITRGAEDDAEMGAFHDAFYPLRNANLRERLDEYTPAGIDTGIFYAD